MESVTFTLTPADMTLLDKFIAKRTKAWRVPEYARLVIVAVAFLFLIKSEVQPYHGLQALNWSLLLETVVVPLSVGAVAFSYFLFQAKKQERANPLFWVVVSMGLLFVLSG